MSGEPAVMKTCALAECEESWPDDGSRRKYCSKPHSRAGQNRGTKAAEWREANRHKIREYQRKSRAKRRDGGTRMGRLKGARGFSGVCVKCERRGTLRRDGKLSAHGGCVTGRYAVEGTEQCRPCSGGRPNGDATAAIVHRDRCNQIHLQPGHNRRLDGMPLRIMLLLADRDIPSRGLYGQQVAEAVGSPTDAVYAALKRLAACGWLSETWEREGEFHGRQQSMRKTQRRHYWRITTAGRARLNGTTLDAVMKSRDRATG